MNAESWVQPLDPHNLSLLENVHPSGWINPDPAPVYNLVVIGAGTAGLVSAAGAAGLGARAALVERGLLGGDCLNFGCVPSKSLIHSSRAAQAMTSRASPGIRPAAAPLVDFGSVMERLRALRSRISVHDSAERFRTLGVDVFLGEARFSGTDRIAVDGKTLRFKKAILATGARPAVPKVPGLEEAGFFTNETVFSLTALPRRLAVLGGGPIGCELAQAFRRLDSEVTLIQTAPQLLPKEDPDAAQLLAGSLIEEGVLIRLSTRVMKVSRQGEAKVLHLDAGGPGDVVIADAILVAVGRSPNCEGLGLERANVHFHPARGVEVNDFLQTTNPRIYAAGDVCLAGKFTHAADASARIALQNALFLGRKRWSAAVVPWCTYTDPEIAHVGLSEAAALRAGIPVTVLKKPLAEVDRAILDGEEKGFVKILLQKGSDRIVGATIVARHAGEMIGELTLAIQRGIGLGRLAGVIHPYPTQAEAIRQLGDAYNRTRLTPRAKQGLGLWFAWSRR